MAPLDYNTIIIESADVLNALLRKSHTPLIRRRLRFLLLLKTQAGMSRAKAGRKLGLEPRGSEEVWKLYKQGGIGKCCDYPFKGRKSTLSPEDKAWLKDEIKKDNTLTLAAAAEKIKVHMASESALTPQAVHYIFKSMKIKKKTGRPSHINKEEEKVEDFKKKGSRL